MMGNFGAIPRPDCASVSKNLSFKAGITRTGKGALQPSRSKMTQTGLCLLDYAVPQIVPSGIRSSSLSSVTG
jgi:hypothetical protein